MYVADSSAPKHTNTNNCRPDGTHLSKQKRPELYKESDTNVISVQKTLRNDDKTKVPETVNSAIFATYKTNEQAIEDVCFYIENNLSDIIQLPELFFVADKSITHDAEKLAHIEALSNDFIKQVSLTLRAFQYACTSLVLNGQHQAVLVNNQGLFATQSQLHFCERYKWTLLGEQLKIIELPLEQGNITVAMLTADDANIPELIKVAAHNHIQVLLVPFDIQEPCESESRLLACARENNLCIVAATREKSFPQISKQGNNLSKAGKAAGKKSTGLIVNLAKEKKAPLIVKKQHGKITKALIYPILACQ